MATVRELVRVAVRAAQEKKATDVKAIDLRGLSTVTDYMIVSSGSSDTNVRAIAENVRERLLEKGERPLSLEGIQDGTWALLDYVDFVVHVFLQEKRAYFGLEELWADAKPVPVAADAPAKKAAARAGAKAAGGTARRVTAVAAPPPSPRAALKPSKKTAAVPKKAAPKKTEAAPAKGKAVSKRTGIPKPKKATVPKRRTKD